MADWSARRKSSRPDLEVVLEHDIHGLVPGDLGDQLHRHAGGQGHRDPGYAEAVDVADAGPAQAAVAFGENLVPDGKNLVLDCAVPLFSGKSHSHGLLKQSCLPHGRNHVECQCMPK